MQQEDMNGTRSLAEEVTEILRNRILQGEYTMGEKLTENKIAAELKVSRTPIRDAFRDIFPATTSQQLYAMTVALRDLTAKFKISETTANSKAIIPKNFSGW